MQARASTGLEGEEAAKPPGWAAGKLPGEEARLEDAGNPYEGETPQALRWYLGIMF